MARYGFRRRFDRFPRYVPVAERRARAEATRAQMAVKGQDLHPAVLVGALKSWWARSWCGNLERYADYSNRIGRGRSYARNGSVVDLRIEAGKIAALVQGSQRRPYKIGIKITILRGDKRKELADLCEGKLESAEALLAGKFPKELEHLLFAERGGLFPDPRQIEFSCSCPDSASMCKHIAAALYGTGARLDEDPSLFFLLRGMKMEELVGRVVEKSAEKLLRKKRGVKGESKLLELDDGALGALFGLDFGVGSKPGRRRKA